MPDEHPEDPSRSPTLRLNLASLNCEGTGEQNCLLQVFWHRGQAGQRRSVPATELQLKIVINPIASRTAFHHRGSSPDLVQPIQCGNLVCFRERRVVENAVSEELDRAVQREHGLTDVDDLSRALAYRMHAQHLQ